MVDNQRKLTSPTLVLASHNEGKLAEIRALVAKNNIEVYSAADLELEEVEETGSTFAENAEIKAIAAMKETGLPSLSDDSGLSIDALDGAPGIYSARWAGPDKDFAQAMRNIEEKLQGAGAIKSNARGAEFICDLCLVWPDGDLEHFVGKVRGEIVWPPRGTNGFGYDAVFQPEGFTKTFAEMSAVEKREGVRKVGGSSGGTLSHRAKAFQLFATKCL